MTVCLQYFSCCVLPSAAIGSCCWITSTQHRCHLSWNPLRLIGGLETLHFRGTPGRFTFQLDSKCPMKSVPLYRIHPTKRASPQRIFSPISLSWLECRSSTTTMHLEKQHALSPSSQPPQLQITIRNRQCHQHILIPKHISDAHTKAHRHALCRF